MKKIKFYIRYSNRRRVIARRLGGDLVPQGHFSPWGTVKGNFIVRAIFIALMIKDHLKGSLQVVKVNF